MTKKSPVASRKSQGALEYLITYGWAILIIVIIGGALFALGVFNPSSWATNKRATGFTAVQVKDWSFIGVTPQSNVNQLIMVLNNKAGYPVKLWNITTAGSAECNIDYGTGYDLTEDETSPVIPGLCTPASAVKPSQAYSVSISIYYYSNGINHTDFGTITGKAE